VPKAHGSTREATDLLAVANTVRDEYSRLREQLVRERQASALNRPPVVLPAADKSAVSEYWRRVEESGARTRLTEATLSKLNQRLLKLVPEIRRALIYLSALSPQGGAFLDAFNQLALATATAETLLLRPDEALQDVATMIDLLRGGQESGGERRGASRPQPQAPQPRRKRPKLGQQLRAARDRAGHSQRQAAEKMGYDHKNISEWETGKRKPRPDTAKNIRDYILRYPEAK
jgi:DNA-binding XRE family transcriptional regulator